MFRWIKELVTPVTSLVRGLVTTDKDRLDAVERMAKIDTAFGSKELDYKISLSANGNFYTRSVRPTIAYVFLLLYVKHKSIQDFVFDDRDYELFLYIVGFYFALRGTEKFIGSFTKK